MARTLPFCQVYGAVRAVLCQVLRAASCELSNVCAGELGLHKKNKGVSYAHPYSYSSPLIIPQFARAVKHSLRANHLRQALDTTFRAIHFHYTTGRHFCQVGELRLLRASQTLDARRKLWYTGGLGVSVRASYKKTHELARPRTNTQEKTKNYTNLHTGREPFAPSPSRPAPRAHRILLGVSEL